MSRLSKFFLIILDQNVIFYIKFGRTFKRCSETGIINSNCELHGLKEGVLEFNDRWLGPLHLIRALRLRRSAYAMQHATILPTFSRSEYQNSLALQKLRRLIANVDPYLAPVNVRWLAREIGCFEEEVRLLGWLF